MSSTGRSLTPPVASLLYALFVHSDRGIAWWPRRRSRALDIALAVSAAVIDCAFAWFSTEGFFLPGPVVVAVSFLLGLCLVVRRRFPVSVAIVCLVLAAAAGAGFLSYLIAFYTLGAYAVSRRVVLITGAAALLAFVVQPRPALSPEEPLWILLVVGTVLVTPPVLLGLYMGTRKQLIASLQERAARLEREQHLLAERARAEERTRIAREMHDVVANRVSVMVVQAGAVRAIAGRDPASAAEAAAVIGDMG